MCCFRSIKLCMKIKLKCMDLGLNRSMKIQVESLLLTDTHWFFFHILSKCCHSYSMTHRRNEIVF